MTVSSGFFNSVNHDRLYDAEQLSSIFDGVIEDGVYQAIGEAFKVSVVEDAENVVKVGTGRAWFDHTWTVNDSTYAITLDPPNEALGRIDAIVLDVDRTQAVRKNSIEYVRGVYSESPQKPTLTKSDLHNQYPLAYITMPKGSGTVITNSNIEIMVGTSECPLVIGVLESFNGDLFIQQLDAEFNEWWDGIKDVLDTNTATKLQNQINDLGDQIESLESKQFTAIAPKKAVIHFALNTWYSLKNPRILILPDGNLFVVGVGDLDKFPRSSYPVNSADNFITDHNLIFGLYSLDGIMSKQTSLGTVRIPVSYNSLSSTYSTGWSLISYDIDSYPAVIRILHVKSVDVIDSFEANYAAWFKPSRYTYTLSTITITEDHVVSVQNSDVAAPIAVSGARGGHVQNMSNIPANIPGDKHFVMSYSGFRTSVSNADYDNCIVHGLMVDSDGVLSLTANKYFSEAALYGDNEYSGNIFTTFAYYNNASGTIQVPPRADAPSYSSNYQTVIFNSDGTYKKISTSDADYTNKNIFENIEWFQTDYNVLSNGYYYHQDSNDPNKIVGEPYNYTALVGSIGDMPTVSPLINATIIGSDSGGTSNDYSGLPNMEKANIDSSSSMVSIVREPSGAFIAASAAADLSVYDGGAFRFLIGSGGIWSGYYGYYTQNVEQFGGPYSKAFYLPTYINSQILQKKCYWSNSTKTIFLIVIPGDIGSVNFVSDGNTASKTYKSEAFHNVSINNPEVWYIEI